MSNAAQEIASQPGCWPVAAELAATTDALPRRGERVCAVGCGTGHNIAMAYAQLRERSGLGITDALASSELAETRSYDRFLFISRSGTTTETVQALRRVAAFAPTVALTADPDAPLANEATQTVSFKFADELSVVETRFATSVIVTLRVHLGQDAVPMIEAAGWGLATELPEGALEARQHTFLGRGWTAALAAEAALKLRESAQVWVEDHNAMEYRHGPISIAEPGGLVWCFGEAPAGLESEVRATGASWTATPQGIDPLGDLVRAQRLAVALAEARGLDPDRPRHLSRSVILDRGI